jgi:hypothetical protein
VASPPTPRPQPAPREEGPRVTGTPAPTWPPATPPGTRWHRRVIGRQELRLRRVTLWGSEVLIDEAGRVLCAGCLRLVDIEQLAVDLFGRPVDTDSGALTLSHHPRHRLELPLGYWAWS